MQLPKVTEIARWNPQKGDRLIVNIDGGMISREEADHIRHQVIERLQVPDWVPIIMVAPPVSLTVVSLPEDPSGG